MISKLIEKLRDKEYRAAFVLSHLNIGIPFQVRGLMKSRGWSQQQLAEKAGMLQPRISALLTPGRTRPNLETLRRLANAFDCGLIVKFVPFSDLARWSDQFDPESFDVPSFADDSGLIERKGPSPESTILNYPLMEATNNVIPFRDTSTRTSVQPYHERASLAAVASAGSTGKPITFWNRTESTNGARE